MDCTQAKIDREYRLECPCNYSERSPLSNRSTQAQIRHTIQRRDLLLRGIFVQPSLIKQISEPTSRRSKILNGAQRLDSAPRNHPNLLSIPFRRPLIDLVA